MQKFKDIFLRYIITLCDNSLNYCRPKNPMAHLTVAIYKNSSIRSDFRWTNYEINYQSLWPGANGWQNGRPMYYRHKQKNNFWEYFKKKHLLNAQILRYTITLSDKSVNDWEPKPL